MTPDSKPSDAFPGRLRKAREFRGLSQQALANKAGLPAPSISRFEAGSRKPSFDNLRNLANALDVTTDYLLGRVEDPGVAVAADPIFRQADQLTSQDRELAMDFMRMLAERAGQKPPEE